MEVGKEVNEPYFHHTDIAVGYQSQKLAVDVAKTILKPEKIQSKVKYLIAKEDSGITLKTNLEQSCPGKNSVGID